MVMGEEIPRRPVGAVILPHRPPGAFAEIRPPTLPVRLSLVRFLQPFLFSCHGSFSHERFPGRVEYPFDLSSLVSVLCQDDLCETQGLSDGPGLEGASPRRVRKVPVRDLRDVADAGLVQMPENGIEKFRAGLSLGLARSPPHSRPGLDKGPDEPRPDGSLVIGAVP